MISRTLWQNCLSSADDAIIVYQRELFLELRVILLEDFGGGGVVPVVSLWALIT